jgi:hypothetical protein
MGCSDDWQTRRDMTVSVVAGVGVGVERVMVDSCVRPDTSPPCDTYHFRRPSVQQPRDLLIALAAEQAHRQHDVPTTRAAAFFAVVEASACSRWAPADRRPDSLLPVPVQPGTTDRVHLA